MAHMGRAFVAAAGFALAGGSAADPGACVHVAPVPDRFGRLLLLCVEPLDHTPRGRELAEVAQRTIQEHFSAAPGSGDDALVAAFAAANAAVLAENQPAAGARGNRRICVGATAIAIDGRAIAVAQAPPSQAILVQDGRVYAFPDLASWRGDFAPEDPEPESHPLGFAEDVVPRLYISEAAPETSSPSARRPSDGCWGGTSLPSSISSAARSSPVTSRAPSTGWSALLRPMTFGTPSPSSSPWLA